MIKTIGTAYKRDDFTHDEFFDYWMNVHAPISRQAPGLRGYVVTELLRRIGGELEKVRAHIEGGDAALGLAPRLVGELFEKIAEINRADGVTVLLVEQNARLALAVSTHAHVLETGRVAMSGPSTELRDDPRLKAAYLGG